MARRAPYLRPTWNKPPPGSKAFRYVNRAGVESGEALRERKKFYSSDAWKRLRLAFLGDNPLCIECLKHRRLKEATIAHHIRPRLEYPELALDETNLAPYCNPCHTRLEKSNRGDGHAET